MNPMLAEILPYARKGYCCSQILVLLLLNASGQENPALVRAMQGLCHGMGASEGPCGLLSGGGAVLGCIAGKGEDMEDAHPAFSPLVSEYQQWFANRTQRYGGLLCHQVVEGLSQDAGFAAPAQGEQPNQSLCGELLAECWEAICQLLENYEIPLEMR